MLNVIRPDWDAPSFIKAFTTTRQGGVSRSPFDTLNLAAHVGDYSAHVKENRDRLRSQLSLPSEPLWLNQIHSNIVLNASNMLSETSGDASFTHLKDQVCVVLTADCLPILLTTQTGDYVGVIHAGWRGLAKRIIRTTIRSMQVDPKSLRVWLGPAIGAKCFEVGNEVYHYFKTEDPASLPAFTPIKEASWLFDIYAAARIHLKQEHVGHIFGGDFCTYTEHERFFSFRRDQGKTGRMATLIWICAEA